ncbi:MAG TPA: FAD-dependent oxidoreductase [Methyloceanibacter sp.]|nr:FAD-dependent oxidoreductase [Methyloceanibacter sp.]
MATETITTECAIAGGGPAGIMLGFLLARAGVDVVVLEKHEDFFRDFRGDTIHPSTLQVMHELGLLDEFLKLPHQAVKQLGAQIGDDTVMIADFSHLPTEAKFLAFMPQWDFLDFLATHGKRYPTFHLRMRAEVDELLKDGDRVVGLKAATPDSDLEVRADLVVGTDGRKSTVRALAGLEVEDMGAPMDVLWLRLTRRPEDGDDTLGRIEPGRFFIMINRCDYWQCAFVIPKGGFNELRRKGLEAFRLAIVALKPTLSTRVKEIASWDDVRLLTVKVDRLKRWYRPGLLCIGDAAHAMSPIGGVGINLAIQDAVATANILAAPLLEGRVTEEELQKVQKRRRLPAKLTQALQVFIQNRVVTNVLTMTRQPKPPFFARMMDRFPVLRRLPARLIGMGFRPEHVQTAEAPAQAAK